MRPAQKTPARRGRGPTGGQQLRNFSRIRGNQDLITKLQRPGYEVCLRSPRCGLTPLAGKTFVFTGGLPRLSREEANPGSPGAAR